MCSGVSVPGARTWRTMVPRETESIHSVARSTEGARCSRFPSATVVTPRTPTPTPISMYLPRFFCGSRLISKWTSLKAFVLTSENHEQFKRVPREEPCHHTCIITQCAGIDYRLPVAAVPGLRAQLWELASQKRTLGRSVTAPDY